MTAGQQTVPSAEAAPDVLVQLLTPAARDNPYPIYGWLRDNAPVYRSTFGPHLISRFSGCEYVLKNAELFPGAPEDTFTQIFPQAAQHQAFQILITSLVGSNPPKHTRLRHLVGRDFTMRRVENMRPAIEQLADRLLDEVAERLSAGEVVDLHSSLSLAMPLHVIAELVGVPEEDRRELAVNVPQMMNVVDPTATPEAVQAADEAFARLGAYFDGLITLRRAQPRDDLASALVSAHDNDSDRLTDEELRTLLFTLWSAGFETTATAIDSAVVTLLTHPEQGHWLKDPEGAKAFVEEALRFDPPVQVAPGIRFAAKDVEVDGCQVPAGAQVRLLIGAALRDPRAYPDPDQFDPSRSGPQPLSFGAGIHYCLGAGLSRLEMAILLPKLHERLPGLRLAGEPARRRSMPLRDFDALTVTLQG